SYLVPPPPRSTLFPYTTLFRSLQEFVNEHEKELELLRAKLEEEMRDEPEGRERGSVAELEHEQKKGAAGGNNAERGTGEDSKSADRKSTRLNSSHVAISYAVFC